MKARCARVFLLVLSLVALSGYLCADSPPQAPGSLPTATGGGKPVFGGCQDSPNCGAVVQVLTLPSPVTISRTGVDAEASSTDGSNFVITDGDSAINTQHYPPANVYRRGILEFNIADIPAGMSITEAGLGLEVQAITHGTTDYPVLSLFGYGGDGVLSPADATRTSVLIGKSNQITDIGILITIDLDTDFIESLLGTSEYLGLVAFDNETYHQVGFWTEEAAAFATPPTLTITYVPEPGMFPLLMFGGLAMLRRRRT